MKEAVTWPNKERNGLTTPSGVFSTGPTRGGHFQRECSAPRNQYTGNRDSYQKDYSIEKTTSNALVSHDDAYDYDWSDQSEEAQKQFSVTFIGNKENRCKGTAVSLETKAQSFNTRLHDRETDPIFQIIKNCEGFVALVWSNSTGGKTIGKVKNKAGKLGFEEYSTNSKAFRVFNSRTRTIEENLHVQFSENTSNVAGSGPNWLFDIDALTNSMTEASLLQ
ncbi:hypothetical protein Tco_0058305 [Tanacetum coccineum]